jgi:hypothetical protein
MTLAAASITSARETRLVVLSVGPETGVRRAVIEDPPLKTASNRRAKCSVVQTIDFQGVSTGERCEVGA